MTESNHNDRARREKEKGEVRKAWKTSEVHTRRENMMLPCVTE